MEEFLKPLYRWRDFKGRSQRREYWLWVLMMFCLFMGIFLLERALGLQITTDEGKDGPGVIAITAWFIVLVPWLAVQVRRLHDIGLSGWWILVSLLPYIGVLLIVYWTVKDGQRGPNIYGNDPKKRRRHDVFAP